MKFPRLFALALALCVSASACAQSADPAADKAASLTSRLPDGLYAVVDTPRGVIILSLYYKQAPLAVASFVGLAEGRFLPSGRPYFDGISFHRVEAGFVVQGGDPEGSGYGGPGYQFPNEIVPGLGFGTSGVVGMANAGPGTNGSQFFITLAPARHLDGGYTVFGRVVSGMQAVSSIRKGDPMVTVRIVRRGADAQAFVLSREEFDDLVKKSGF
ncbi:MAG: peptidylprolyl isomerase [Spirochaetia bacterium]|nr:peptidylprolyl isomerase [Spirochaetia bacterium]